MKSTAAFSSFEALDIRVGRILSVEDGRTRKPTYKLTVDFGPEIGIKVSCGAFRHYVASELVGRLVIGVANFVPRQMGPEISEVLVLGVSDAAGDVILLAPESEVAPGAAIF